jgi:predicted RNA-binding protein associated with RNAse of E/G family
MSFSKGQIIQLREMIGEQPWAVRTVEVLDSQSDHAVLWMAANSPFRITEGYLNNPEFNTKRWEISSSGSWAMIDSVWKGNNVLIHKNLDAYYSVQLFWRASDGEFLGYYVNFELPYQRVETGYDTLDLDLDIMVYPNYETQLKDEEEYLHFVETGDIKPEWATEISKAKLEVEKAIEAREFPFDGSLIARKPVVA